MFVPAFAWCVCDTCHNTLVKVREKLLSSFTSSNYMGSRDGTHVARLIQKVHLHAEQSDWPYFWLLIL